MVYDLVAEAGVDVSDWANLKGGKEKAASNPKYCYEWAFIQPAKVVVLNLWFEELQCEGPLVFETRNLRKLTLPLGGLGSQARARRIKGMESAIDIAERQGLPVRVIVCDGPRRDLSDPDSERSSVKRRLLDREAWSVVSYNRATGVYRVNRDGGPTFVYENDVRTAFEDALQISMSDTSEARKERLMHAEKKPTKVFSKSFIFKRNPDVIAEVLDRADGKCEECFNSAPFNKRADGKPYLEVHHRVQLANDGDDTVENAMAICPNCHRRVHYG